MTRRFPEFYLALTHGVSEIRRIIRLWNESGDRRSPFRRIIVTPLFTPFSTVQLIQEIREQQESTIIFDSGGYQVQIGRIEYEDLFDRLLKFFRDNRWASWYVLPDNVPSSSDCLEVVDHKVRRTLDFGERFLSLMPGELRDRAIGVIHGRTEEHLRFCVERYSQMGIRYLAFGSFATSGRNGSVNQITSRNFELLQKAQRLINDHRAQFHILGIGSPKNVLRMQRAGLTPNSFDSSGWWKSGGYGNIFFRTGAQLQITAIADRSAVIARIEHHKSATGHECMFCHDPSALFTNRIGRILHNLAVMVDTFGGA